jgi:predicted CoA-binding protein
MSTADTKIADFLAQKRIAVAGVSRQNSAHPAANLIYRRLKHLGHEVFAINPNATAVEGDRCYPDLTSIPGGVDGVVIVTRPEVTEELVQQCTAAGVTRVWMHQGLSRGATSVSAKAADYCLDRNIAVIAGACPMMYGEGIDFGHRCMRWMLGITGGLPK